MSEEERIKSYLADEFKIPAEKIRIQRSRRLFVDFPLEGFHGNFRKLCKELKFNILLTITGLDVGENLEFIYHLARPDGIVLNLKSQIPKTNPERNTISDLFPGGMIYERELIDMFGAKIIGLPPGNRYPLPEDWPEGQFPLLKSWKADMLKSKSEAPK
ncbi:MAG: NADH-quinone oxidoreductase subunit C [Candidatus Riflebacteria bacterium]|nr:NADH-quinone oxidoreductase subunit C [Candidatus Riflebacteria bacterium]